MGTLSIVVLWGIAALTVALILVRPRAIPEWVWAVGGAVALVALGVISVPTALAGLARGTPVYAFLLGIITLAEIARQERIFMYLSVFALRAAGTSQYRLFALVYGVGILVTALLANDTTVVVLTPAVFSVVIAAELDPLPYAYACAFVAGAASFLLPIANPANLVVFGNMLPALGPWLAAFALSAVVAIVLTFIMLRALFARALAIPIRANAPAIAIDSRMRRALVAVVGATLGLILAAAFGFHVGYVAFAAALSAFAVVGFGDRSAAANILKHLAWQIVPLVAGLFVIVQGLDQHGALTAARALLVWAAHAATPWAFLALSGSIAVADNVFNNLPVGLATGYALTGAHVAPHIAHVALIGVDLGPNLSVTGSLATLLWLIVLRRENVTITPWHFFRYGIVVMIPTLIIATLLVR